MNRLTKILISFCGLLAVVSCDTVEEAYSVGVKPKDSEILSLDQRQLTFTPEGGGYEINVSSIARWEATLTGNDNNQFSVSPSSGKGNGVITVSCSTNPGAEANNAKLLVSAQNFQKDPVEVTLLQTNAVFTISSYPSEEYCDEEGGPAVMTARSTLNWQLEILPIDGIVGDISWLNVSPGLSGEGSYDNPIIDFRFTWSPNYTEQERVIRLQLKHTSNLNLSSLPEPFTLKQSAGTLPQNVRCVVTPIGVVDADITLEYSSRSPVKDCGVRIYQGAGNDETLYAVHRPDVVELSKIGIYNFFLKDLPENSRFRIEPFVENEVGATVGESGIRITEMKPENMTYHGVSIENADNGGVSVMTDLNSAIVSFTVVSDVEPLGNERIESVTVNGHAINGTPESSGSGKWKYTYIFNNLDPNNEYEYEIVVKGRNLPPEQGKVDNNTAVYSGKFKTKGQTPEDNDNNIPNVGA